MKSMEKVVVMFLAIILTAATMSACGGGTGASVPRFSDDVTEIVSFTFPDALNTSLSSDVYATIDGDNITATVPAGTDLTGLVAEYVTDSNSVDAAGVTLESGITSVNYSSRYNIPFRVMKVNKGYIPSA